MRMQRVSRVGAVLILFLVVNSGVRAQDDGSPLGNERGSIVLMQPDGKAVTLEARMAVWKLTGRVRPKGQMSFPLIDSPVVDQMASITVPFSLSDVPGGNLFVVRLEADKKLGFIWGTDAVAKNVPLKDFIVLETAKLRSSKVGAGTLINFEPAIALKPGRYAVVLTNNKYAWPFVVK